MSKYTAGPWKWFESGHRRTEPTLVGADGSPVLHLGDKPSGYGGDVAGEIFEEADARLIASAPDMLEALTRCAELLGSITDIRTDLAEFQNGYLRQARAAIAKATGGDQ